MATIAISYAVMFLYIAIFLGHIRSLRTFFVSSSPPPLSLSLSFYPYSHVHFHSPFLSSLQIDLKLLLGLFGVLIVLLAVSSSIGLLSYFKVEGSLIILEVVPFLVLAVGVDNLFIMVHSYEVWFVIM